MTWKWHDFSFFNFSGHPADRNIDKYGPRKEILSNEANFSCLTEFSLREVRLFPLSFSLFMSLVVPFNLRNHVWHRVLTKTNLIIRYSVAISYVHLLRALNLLVFLHRHLRVWSCPSCYSRVSNSQVIQSKSSIWKMVK